MPKSKYRMPNESSGRRMSTSGSGSSHNSGTSMNAPRTSPHNAGNNRPQTYMAGLGKGSGSRMRMGGNTGASGGLKMMGSVGKPTSQTAIKATANPYPHGLA